MNDKINFRLSGILADGWGPDRRVAAVYVRLEGERGYVLAAVDGEPDRLLGRITADTTLAQLGEMLLAAFVDAGDPDARSEPA